MRTLIAAIRGLDPAKGAFVAACILMVFSFGTAVGRYQIFPFTLLKFGEDAVAQVFEEHETILGTRPAYFLQPTRYDGSGVVHLDAAEAAPGLTLLTGFYDGSNEIRLIRLDGTVVNRWPVSYFDTFPEVDHVAPAENLPQTEWNWDIHGAVALPDGSVVFNFEYLGTAKLDRCGGLEWALPHMTHHSIEPAEDGGFWIAGRYWVEGPSTLPPLETPYAEDTILRVSEDGDILGKISVPALFFTSDHLRSILFGNGMTDIRVPQWQLVHLNDIEELPGAMASRFPQFEAGDLLLSLRNLNLLMVVDFETRQVKWHQQGPWMKQHDPDFQPNGTISVFNNNSDDTLDGSIFGGSNIMELDPATGEVQVRYGGKPGQMMFTNHRGKHQYVGPEGRNVLITEAEGGRIFEVNPEGQVVWEYIERFDAETVVEVNQATRYPEGYFTVDDWACQAP